MECDGDPTEQGRSRLYTYNALNSRSSDIRLIRLKPAQMFDEPLHCEIIVTNMHSTTYSALSYVWGNPNFTKILSCLDDTVLPITETLDFALRRLRAAHVQLLWVDAISINQADVAERTSQVKMMGSIYDLATHVHVWLGEDDGETIGLNVFGHLRQEDQLSPGQQPMYDYIRVRQLLQRTFWSRRWIIQEVMLARELTFHWGINSISGRQLYSGLATISGTLQFEDKDALKAVLAMRSLNGARHENTTMMGEFQDGTPMTMFRTFADYKCKDEGDIVFSLLGLLGKSKPISSSPSFARLLQSVDYRASALDTHIALAHYHLTFLTDKTRCVPDILEYALSTRSLPWPASDNLTTPTEDGWPSWLPDWRRNIIYRPCASADFTVHCGSNISKVELGIAGSSAINRGIKCLSIAVVRSEEIIWVERFENESDWNAESYRLELLNGPTRKFRTKSYRGSGHPGIRPGDFVAFVGRPATLVPFAFRPVSNTHDLRGKSKAVLVGDCKLKHRRSSNPEFEAAQTQELLQRFRLTERPEFVQGFQTLALNQMIRHLEDVLKPTLDFSRLDVY